MATTKKKPVAKTTTKAAAKKPTTARKSTAKKQKVIEHRSFRPSAEKSPFLTFKFTQQSVYWLVLSALVLGLGSWVMYLNVRIQTIYDQVEINTQLNEDYIVPAIQQHHPDAGKPKAQ